MISLYILTLLPTQEWKPNPTQICSLMFVTTLFLTAQTCKQPRYPSVGVWNKQWYIQKTDYSRLKKNELSSHEKAWRKLKWLLSVRSQSEMVAYILYSTYNIWKRKNYSSSKKVSSCQEFAVKILCILWWICHYRFVQTHGKHQWL